MTTHPYGKLALMADPFGNGFCLLEFTGRGYDEITVTSVTQAGPGRHNDAASRS